MRHLLFYILLLSTATSYAQPYDDIMSDWCKMGLKGEVRELKTTYYMAKTTKGGHFEIIKSLYKFSKDGYITKVLTRIDGASGYVEQYNYFSNTEKHIGYIKKWQRRTLHTQDSVIIEQLTDTSFTAHSYNTEYDYKETSTYIFNKQHQLIAHSSVFKDGKKAKTTNSYNNAGHLIKEEYTFKKAPYNTNTTFDTKEVDSMGNPQFVIDTFQNSRPRMVSRRRTSYTYYK